MKTQPQLEDDDFISDGVDDGLYDPVLDDTEIIYVPVGPADSDQASNLDQPTEVQFEIKQFTDEPNIPRSLNGSPFLVPIKPYRPFSTEPLEVPPLEEPIILNPDYRDVFPDVIAEDLPPETKFKLPISEQYDPEGKKHKKEAEEKQQTTADAIEVEYDKKAKEESKKTIIIESEMEMRKDEIEYLEQMKKDIDIDKIEETASLVVDESIHKAVSVAEEIKKEMDVELSMSSESKDITVESKVQKESMQADFKSSSAKKETQYVVEEKFIQDSVEVKGKTLSETEIKEATKVVNNLAEMIDKTTDDIIKQREVSVAKEVEKFETLDKQEEFNKKLEERKLLGKQEIEETIEMGTVRRKSEIFDKESQKIDTTKTSQSVNEDQIKTKIKRESEIHFTENQKSERRVSDPKAEHRAYTIGLQTIPNIRGSVHTSYHYNLLLKTFFVHLADVMVALSRFILTEPITKTDEVAAKDYKTSQKIQLEQDNLRRQNAQSEHKESHQRKDSVVIDKTKSQTSAELSGESGIRVTDHQEELNRREIMTKEAYEKDIDEEFVVVDGVPMRRTKLSGAKIAQIEGRKPPELTDKMDVVISEFQRRSGIEEQEVFRKRSRSRSRSKLSGEMPQEDLLYHKESKFDDSKLYEEIHDTEKRSLEVKEIKSHKHYAESKESKSEVREHYNEEFVKPSDTGNLTYVAIVEAHVYTNKEAIFEERMRRLSESKYTSQTTESTVKDSRKLSLANTTIIEPIEEITAVETLNEEKEMKQAHVSVERTSKAVAQKTSVAMEEGHKSFESSVIKSEKSHVLIEKPVKTVAEKSEVLIEEHKTGVIDNLKVSMEKAKTVEETKAKAVAQKSEVVTEEINTETLDLLEAMSQKPRSIIEMALMTAAETVMTTAVEQSDSLKIMKSDTKQQATVKLEEIEATETIDVSIEEPKYQDLVLPQITPKQTQAVSEETRLTVAETVTIIPEEAKDESFEITKAVFQQAAVNVEALKAAEIIVVEAEESKSENFEVSKIANQQAHVAVEELKAVETIMVSLEEPKQEILTLPEVVTKHTQSKLEESIKSVAQTTEVNLSESEQEIILAPKTVTKEVSVKFESVTPVAQSSIITYEETGNDVSQISVSSNKAKIAIVESTAAAVAETTAVTVAKEEEFKISKKDVRGRVIVQEPVIAEAKVEEVSVQEAKLQILDVSDDKITHEAAVSSEYTVELAKEEDEKASVTVQRKKTLHSPPAKEEYMFQLDIPLSKPHIYTSESITEEASLQLKSAKPHVITAEEEEATFTLIKQNGYVDTDIDISQSEEYESQTLLASATHATDIKAAEISQTMAMQSKSVTYDSIETRGASKAHETKSLEVESSKILSVQADSAELQSTQHIHSEKSKNASYVSSEAYGSVEMAGSHGVSVQSSSASIKSMESKVQLEESSIATSKTFESMSMETDSSQKVALQSSVVASKLIEGKISSVGSLEHKSVGASIESDSRQKLALQTDLAQTKTIQNGDDNGKTPSPTSVPPTPLTDEYMFRLETPLPEETTFVPRDCSFSPESVHEEDIIIKNGLKPNIEIQQIEHTKYDTPLPTPPTSPDRKVGPAYTKPGLNGGSVRKFRPVYIKPGLRGGSDRQEVTKEEIREIERKSTLLASAIDKTIKSIEEYKESVGIDTTNEVSVHHEKKEFASMKTVEASVSSSTKMQNGNGEFSNTIEELNHKGDVGISEINENGDMVNGFSRKSPADEYIVIKNGSNDANSKKEKKEDFFLNELKAKLNGRKHEETEQAVTFTIVSESNKNHINGDVQERVQQQNGSNTQEISVDVTIKNSDLKEHKSERTNHNVEQNNDVAVNISIKANKKEESKVKEVKKDPLEGYHPVQFDPDSIKPQPRPLFLVSGLQEDTDSKKPKVYVTDKGEVIGSVQGIVDGLEEAVVEPEVAKELGKPGLTEDKIAELISGESEMLREAHVMGLKRVLNAHIHRQLDDDSSVDFNKIKPVVDSLKDSEVLKALNEEMMKSKDEKRKEERRWTTFLQKPQGPTQRKNIVYYGDIKDAKMFEFETPYKVKIVKQPKPKVAPDYKPEDFDTGPLPWEERAQEESSHPPVPVEPEEPILVPEEIPEFLEAIDPLPESEVPDLEDTGIPLPPSPKPQEVPFVFIEERPQEGESQEEGTEEIREDIKEEEQVTSTDEEMERMNLAEQLMKGVESMVDPNAPLEQQLAQMRAQLAALAQLPNVIQQTLELVTKQISQMSAYESSKTEMREEHHQDDSQVVQEETQNQMQNEENSHQAVEITDVAENEDRKEQIVEEAHEPEPSVDEEELARIQKEQEERMLEEQKRMEKQKKEKMRQMKLEQESRQVKQRSAPRVGKPRPMFGPPIPQERPVVLPGGRRWKKPQDAYNDQMISETLTAQAEVIKGKAIGVNFMKYEKPPVALDHLQKSEVYKVIHNMDQPPLKRVEMLTPVIAEADYRERVRSISPCTRRVVEEHLDMPEQLEP